MRILHIIPNINKRMGGSVYAVINILMLEKEMDIKSSVISIKAEDIDISMIEYAAVKILPPSFPKRFSRSRDANKWLINNARKYDLAVIHTIWGALQIEASHIFYRLKVPFIICPHGSLDPFDLRKKKYLKKLMGPFLIRQMLDKCEAIVCTAKLEAERLQGYGTKSKIIVMPLPISNPPGTGNRRRFREKFSIANDDFVLLFLSLIYYKKGLELLILALNKLSARYPNLKLIIAGSDLNGYEKKVRTWIRDYNLENRIIMPGFLSGQDKQDAFAGSDCFVLPSMNENFGIAVVEAISAGLPVLISDNVYIWKEIIHSGGGWVCKYSIESVIDSIIDILKDPSNLKEKKGNARKAAQLFSFEKLGESYKQLYQQIGNKYVQ